MKKIVFTGGGTLGHVMPNLYLCEDLKGKFDLFYIGSHGMEKGIVKGKNLRYYEIDSVKLVRGKIFTNLKIPFVLIKSIIDAKKTLKEIKPDLIFSKGGYVSLPVCIAGKMLKIPIIAHESDYSFGLSNKIILKLCDTMCVNFKNLERKSKKIVYTGAVLSKEFDSKVGAKSLNLDSAKPTILIIGGSLGSKKINDIVFSVLRNLLEKFNIIHITGKGNKRLNSFDNYNAFESYDKMSELYNSCDLVLGRSGAGVTSESFYKLKPMLLIPLQNKATRGDQLLNAKYYESMGVAKILPESELNPTNLISTLENFSKNLNSYREKYKKLKITNGKEKVLHILNSKLNATKNSDT